MGKAKVAITLEDTTLKQIDHLVACHVYPNRSRAIEQVLQEKLQRLARNRLADECAKLDPEFEKKLAEEGVCEELDQWPDY